MSTEHSWLPGMVETLEDNLLRDGIGTNAGLRNHYALVGFGRNVTNPRARILRDSRGVGYLPFEGYVYVNDLLESGSDGRIEDGYQAIIHALDNLQHRGSSSVALNIILVTDEDRDILAEAASLTRDLVKQRILAEGAALNVVIDNDFQAYNNSRALGVDSFGMAYLEQGNAFQQTKENIRIGAGYRSTRQDYTELALETGGAAWDIRLLREGGDFTQLQFTEAFTRVKTAEIRQRTTVCRRCECGEDGRWSCRVDEDQEKCRCRVKYRQDRAQELECILTVDLPQCPPETIYEDPDPSCPVECVSNVNCSRGETCCRKGCSSTCEDAFDCSLYDVEYRLTPFASDIAADIIMVVDESNSMEQAHRWLRSMVHDLDDRLRESGIGTGRLNNHYMLVGFGHAYPHHSAHPFAVNGRRDVTDANVDALLRQLHADDNGYIEDGYEALIYAIDNLPIRRGNDRVPVNIIFVSDEDRDLVNVTYGSRLTEELVRERLARERATLNMVLDQTFFTASDPLGDRTIGMDNQRTAYLSREGGKFTRTNIGTGISYAYNATREQYTELAWQLNGAVWDISQLKKGGDLTAAFTQAFVHVKTQEVRRQLSTCQRCDCARSLFWNCQPDTNQERCQCNVAGKRWNNQLGLCIG
ncbi:uncharacterized protein LOC135809858 [Sycon ciliatum]|uniref:uncharacterized protein LOC135809858 n=1 Tax=Sycon ciliatum TaxID=27933 RepID=UPI0031F6973E